MPISYTTSQNNELFWEGSHCLKSLVICDSRFESQIAITVKSRDLEHLVWHVPMIVLWFCQGTSWRCASVPLPQPPWTLPWPFSVFSRPWPLPEPSWPPLPGLCKLSNPLSPNTTLFRESLAGRSLIKGIAKGGVKNRNKGGCKRLLAFVHVCSRLLAFACVFASAFACVCPLLSAFAYVCSHLLTPPFVAPPSAWHWLIQWYSQVPQKRAGKKQ